VHGVEVLVLNALDSGYVSVNSSITIRMPSRRPASQARLSKIVVWMIAATRASVVAAWRYFFFLRDR